MNTAVNKIAPLLGRILLALIFLLSGVNKIGGFSATAGWMAAKGLPMADVLLVLTIVVEIGAAIMIMIGWKARLGALALVLFTIPVTLIFHNFWAVPADQHQLQMIMFMKNLAMIGGMLFIMAYGSGPLSVERR